MFSTLCIYFAIGIFVVMIEINDLRKFYGNKLAVDNISFKVEKGDVLGFIGPNGAGKSTTMRIITGFIPASAGTVRVGGYDIEKNPIEAKSLIGYLPESAPLYANMTVSGFLSFCAGMRGFSGNEKKQKVNQVIEACFLGQVANQGIDTLSKGFRHRTCFAQSIIHDPDVLVLDEPTDGLDPNQKREIRKLIKSMGTNKAIILSTHILEEIEEVCSRLILIDKGKNVYDGTPEEFRRMSSSYGAVTLEVLNEKAQDICEVLTQIKGVSEVKVIREGEWGAELTVYRDQDNSGASITSKVFNTAKSLNWNIDEFKVEPGDIKEVFHNITENDEGEAL
jgi:ABC-2 type transport system ATP-binding protein